MVQIVGLLLCMIAVVPFTLSYFTDNKWLQEFEVILGLIILIVGVLLILAGAFTPVGGIT